VAERSYDIVFLDIRMPGLSGLDALPLIRHRQDAEVVFVTAYEQHALEAFELAAADYVLKPVSEARLRRTLDRLALRRAPARPQVERLAAEGAQGALLLRIEDIRFIEAQGHATLARTFEQTHRTRFTLAELERRFGRHGFVRVHRSYLVNLEHVVSLEPFFGGSYLLRVDDRERTEIPVSRSSVAAVRATFGV